MKHALLFIGAGRDSGDGYSEEPRRAAVETQNDKVVKQDQLHQRFDKLNLKNNQK